MIQWLRPKSFAGQLVLESVKVAIMLVAVAAILGSLVSLALGDDSVPGAVRADVVSVYDGDTIKVRAHPWPDIMVVVSVRVRGVDTPEIRGKCQAERDQAIRARDFVRRLLRTGESVMLHHVEQGKYAGRVVSDVFIEGRSLSDLLIRNGLARRYDGGARKGWCG